MKKILIVIMCLFLTACQQIRSQKINEVNDLKIERNDLFEANVDRLSDYDVFDIDKNYAYLKNHDEAKNLYEFYRLDKNNNLDCIFSYDYSNVEDDLLSLRGIISRGELYITINNFEDNTSKILKINNQKEQVIYENNNLLWILYNNEDYFLVDETINVGNVESQSYKQSYKYSIFDLKAYQMELLLEETIEIKNSSIKDYEITNISQIVDDGFIYQKNKTVYYFNLNTHKSEKIIKLGEQYDSLKGNKDVLFAVKDKNIHFITKQKGKITDYIYDLKYISNVNDVSLINNNLYFIYENAFRGYVCMFDIENNALSIYNYEHSEISGDYKLYNGELYLITQNNNFLKIEKCV